MQEEIKYDPGDHVGIIACNRKELVETILGRLKDVDDCDEPIQLQLMKETHTSSGIILFTSTVNILMVENYFCYNNLICIAGPVKSWEPHERLPVVSVRELFTRFLDITTPPTTILLQYLAKTCENEEEAKQLNILATVSKT